MNFAFHRYRTMPRFCFDENADGTGSSAPAGASGSSAPASGEPSGTPSSDGSTSGGSSSSSVEPAAPDGLSASDPFSGMDDDFDAIDLEAGTDPSLIDPAITAAPPAPVVPAAAPAPVATPPADPQVAAAPPASGNDPASSRSPLEQAMDGFKTHEKELAVWAGQNLFKLPPEDAEALTTNAEEVIPRLMGQVYQQAMVAAANLIRNFVPQMIDSRVETTTGAKAKASEALNEFYSANTHIDKKHQPVVDKYAKLFRAANPQATRQDAIRAVGIMVSAELGLSPGAPQAPRVPPFAPARPGGRQQVAPNVNDDAFAGLDHDFDVE